jgi:type IV secretion system protein VirB11
MTPLHDPDDYLALFLAPLAPLLSRPDTTDVYVNRPGEAWVESLDGAVECHFLPDLGEEWLWQLARQMARAANQGISRAEPLLSASLPDGTRVQVVAPPATRTGFAMAFRRQVTRDFSLHDLDRTAMFAETVLHERSDPDRELEVLHSSGDIVAFLSAAVKQRKTILVSGGTSTGKTTFVNALLREVPEGERLIAIEDSAELTLSQPNSVGLLTARGRLGESSATADDLLQACMRLRPDRILLGELRGPEALTFLRAINTGHPGSMTTVHADSPERALDQLVSLALQSNTRMDSDGLRHQVRTLVDVVIQLERKAGRRQVAEVRWHRRQGGANP